MDPFGERTRARTQARVSVLGGDFSIASDSAALLGLALDAFAGLPRHRLGGRALRLSVRLVATERDGAWPDGEAPPRAQLSAGGGLLCATVDCGNFVVVDPRAAQALVAVSPRMLSSRYHARYELIELAFVTLASRAQSLVPLHAACVGANGSGVLLMGASGAGKSTLSLLALANGLDFLSEDSTFVALDGLRATGTPNYLHVQPSTLELLPAGALRRRIARAPLIVRRSGVFKHEVDLRTLRGVRLASAPLRLAATVFVSPRAARRGRVLVPIGERALRARLRCEQPYAARLSTWPIFERRLAELPAYELRRTADLGAGVEVLRELARSGRG